MQADLKLKGSDYSWIASAVSIGWLVAAYPSSLMLQKFPISKLVGCFIISWGSLCMLSAASSNFGGLFAIRLIQGIAEALISPAWMMLTGILWTADEAPMRSSMWLGVDGAASIFGSLLAWGLGQTDTPVPNWKLVFLVGILMLLYLTPDLCLTGATDCWRNHSFLGRRCLSLSSRWPTSW
jgi:MFS family permease